VIVWYGESSRVGLSTIPMVAQIVALYLCTFTVQYSVLESQVKWARDVIPLHKPILYHRELQYVPGKVCAVTVRVAFYEHKMPSVAFSPSK
jgi:hypothetical protein